MTTETCKCECKGIKQYTPATIFNPAGLSSLSYRVGTHGRFKAQMVSEISSQAALAKLTTRSDSDLSIALLDSWATIADVLAFYQERIANEGFLRTAKEKMSVLELARSIGYELRPGVAANTYLSFKLDTSPGSPKAITIDAGTKVQSIPGREEKPQVFETSEIIDARQEWNEIKPRQVQKQDIIEALKIGEVLVEGVATKLRPGDGLLFVVGGSPLTFRVATEVHVDSEKQQTKIRFEKFEKSKVAEPSPSSVFAAAEERTVIDSRTNFTSKDLEELKKNSWSESALETTAELKGWSIDVIINSLNSLVKQRKIREIETEDGVYALRTKSGVFGHNAPAWRSLPAEMRYSYKSPTTNDGNPIQPPYPESTSNWDSGRRVNKKTDDNYYDQINKNLIYLDNTYPSIQPKSWIILKDSSRSSAFFISTIREDSLTEFAISGKATGLVLDSSKWVDTESGISQESGAASAIESFDFRGTTIHAQSEKLILADIPLKEDISGQEITLEKEVGWLKEKMLILVEGELADNPSTMQREVVPIESVSHSQTDSDLVTTIKLPASSALQYVYKRTSVTINANVARATHGDTKQEAIGSGDPTQRFQSFELKQNPLTFIHDSSATGAKSTLEINIDNVKWREAPLFEGLSGADKVYVTRRDNDGKTRVIFGDGLNGRLPPSGSENIMAKYRVGIGKSGLLGPDKLTLLMKRPLGVKSVTNPLPTTDAADPEELADARKNAPRTVLTLDRIVSIKDFADFARGYASVGKATAYEIDYWGERMVLVAIASSTGKTVNDVDDLYMDLRDAIEKHKDPSAKFLLRSYNKKAFNVRAKILVSRDREYEKVKADVENALKETFSFDNRDFGQAITLSEVMSVIQRVGGVEAVDIDSLYEYLPGSTSVPDKPEGIIRASGIGQPDGAIIPSLLLVNGEGIAVEKMSQ